MPTEVKLGRLEKFGLIFENNKFNKNGTYVLRIEMGFEGCNDYIGRVKGEIDPKILDIYRKHGQSEVEFILNKAKLYIALIERSVKYLAKES
jgi:hypothetical protein